MAKYRLSLVGKKKNDSQIGEKDGVFVKCDTNKK